MDARNEIIWKGKYITIIFDSFTIFTYLRNIYNFYNEYHEEIYVLLFEFH